MSDSNSSYYERHIFFCLNDRENGEQSCAHDGAKAGFDLTLPWAAPGGEGSIEQRIPEPPRLEGKRFSSVEAALADGPKTFEELMAALASRDGREVVLTLEALREAGRLIREKDGRYALRLS